MEEVRERLRVPRGSTPSRRDLRQRARWGLAPIVSYLSRSLDEDEYDALTEDDLGDLVFELYKIAAARTRLSRSYREIFDSQQEWQRLCRWLIAVRDGATVEAPEGGAAQRRGVCLLYTSPSPRDATLSRMPSSA